MDSISNIRAAEIFAELQESARKHDRNPHEVALVMATKTRSSHEIAAAISQMHTLQSPVICAENRAQELSKHKELGDLDYELHFIGTLQRNKLTQVMDACTTIQSVDRPSLVAPILRRADDLDTPRNLYLQVNTSGEASKGGFEVNLSQITEAALELQSHPQLTVRGLMTIGAHVDDEKEIRAGFSALRELRERLRELPELSHLTELSMGMSNDADLAIAEGATQVRIGTAIFGPRN